jgi:hypothetical protein
MNGTILRFPGNYFPTSNRKPARSDSHHNPLRDELIYSSLDLSFQVGVTISHVDREIIDTITRDRFRRLYA